MSNSEYLKSILLFLVLSLLSLLLTVLFPQKSANLHIPIMFFMIKKEIRFIYVMTYLSINNAIFGVNLDVFMEAIISYVAIINLHILKFKTSDIKSQHLSFITLFIVISFYKVLVFFVNIEFVSLSLTSFLIDFIEYVVLVFSFYFLLSIIMNATNKK